MREKLQNISKIINERASSLETEEATKHALIMPFLVALGYDVFNPSEVVPEYTTDVGTKKGEKVDYVIMRDGEPSILIECKKCAEPLSITNESQLLRYFHVSKAQFGVLTNGIEYRFYTDLEHSNIMDTTPFLIVDLSDPEKIDYNEVEKFRKDVFSIDSIRKTADHLKAYNDIRGAVEKEIVSPSEEFVKYFFRGIGGKVFNQNAAEKYTPIVKSAINDIIEEKVQQSITNAFNASKAKKEAEIEAQKEIEPPEIVTTEDELNGERILKAIGAELVDVERIKIKDAKSYCAVLLDFNNRRPIARLYFNNPQKLSIGLFDQPEEHRESIEKVSDIYKFRPQIIETIKKYCTENT